ncbi:MULTISPECIES: helix-turn-helix transcriptional regulator [Halomonadaceae]|uniref:helix-turn-helix domain-containing protein n=1 Tax=Halomonadaceae TaxID=28256 RepID=UPI00159B5360|nr:MULTISPECIES: helix-turn-helix transcriptional regulator [Halomonas]QJQ96033.1 helix-turn-helix domain-containing protein [Halomonas sp. PA5]
MSSYAKAFMQEVHQTEEGRELADRVLLSLRLGRLVYRMRTTAELSQVALARRIGSTQSAISRLESGNAGHVPGNELLESIARSCGFRMILSAVPIEEGASQEEDLVTAISIDLNQDQGMEQI